MPILDDRELLRRYAEDDSQDAFTELVQRHLKLVYSAALRQVANDAALAQDVAQMVFGDLARKAATLSRHPLLIGWLYRSTRFAAADIMRSRHLRQKYEQKAVAMNQILAEGADEADWDYVRPVIDEMLAGLNRPDRHALLLRFFEGRSFSEVASALKLTEDSARMRVNRALERVRDSLRRRGIRTSSAALALALTEHASAAVPAHLFPLVSNLALLAGSTASRGAVAKWAAWNSMNTTKITIGLSTTIAILALGTAIYEGMEVRKLKSLIIAADKELYDVRTAARKTDNVFQALRSTTVRTNPPIVAPSPKSPPEGPPAVPSFSRAVLDSAKETLMHIRNPHSSRLGEISGIDQETVAAVRAWMDRDPEAVIQWLQTIPTEGNQQMHTIEAVIAIEASSDPQVAFDLANSINQEFSRIARIGDVLKVWAPLDPAAAATAVQSADIPEQYRTYYLNKISEINSVPQQ